MEFEYAYSTTANGQVDIEDYGNCAIEANNLDGQFWYLIIDTKLGWTQIMEYGPIDPKGVGLEDSCVCLYDKVEFNGKKIARRVDMFLNKGRNGFSPIEQAREISKESALSQCKSIIDYMKKGSV